MLNSIFEPGNIGCTQTELARPVHYMYPRVLRGNLVGQFARSIRRVIIYNQYIRSGRIREYLIEQRVQIIVFVIRRNDDKRFHVSVSPECDVAATVCKSGWFSGLDGPPLLFFCNACSSLCCIKMGVCWVAL